MAASMKLHGMKLTDIRPAIACTALALSEVAQADPLSRATLRLPQVPPPPQAQIEWIAKSMRMNGLPMSLQAFRCPLHVDATLHHFESWWSTADAGTRGSSQRRSSDERSLLALTSPRYHITIEARPTLGGSEGTIAVSRNPSAARRSTETRFPLPRNVRIVNLQEYEDPDASAEHISLLSHRGVLAEARDFSAQLTRSGWNVVRDQEAQTIAHGHVLEAQRGADLALITLQPARGGGSSITVIWRKA
jgi:hypothetical protein